MKFLVKLTILYLVAMVSRYLYVVIPMSELDGLKLVMKTLSDYLRKDPVTKSINRHLKKEGIYVRR